MKRGGERELSLVAVGVSVRKHGIDEAIEITLQSWNTQQFPEVSG